MLNLPVVLLKSPPSPLAVFSSPVVLFASASSPVAVLERPVVLLKSAPAPTAVLPSAVLNRSVPAYTLATNASKMFASVAKRIRDCVRPSCSMLPSTLWRLCKSNAA